jgi:hypothetical protein
MSCATRGQRVGGRGPQHMQFDGHLAAMGRCGCEVQPEACPHTEGSQVGGGTQHAVSSVFYHMDNQFSRRDFLKTTAMAAAAVAVAGTTSALPHEHANFSLPQLPYGYGVCCARSDTCSEIAK